MSIILRDYQEKVLSELLQWFTDNLEGNPLVNACVGAGKSIMIAELIRRILEAWPGQRIVMLAPSRELIRQNYEKILSIWPGAPVGIHCAGLGKKDMTSPIIFASVSSIHKSAFDMAPFDIGMVDEAHNINSSNKGLYRKYIAAQLTMNKDFRLVGWSGTCFRGNGVHLWDGEEPIFTDIAAQVTMTELLKDGYLTPLSVAETTVKADTSNVKMAGGDFVLSQLAKAVDVPENVNAACDELVRLGRDRKSWLCYGATVEHAIHICQALQERGIEAAVVSQHTTNRDGIIKAFKAGQIRALINVAVLSVGFDAPCVDLIALMRPTRSPVLYVQIAGRGMRLADGKVNCLWCDFSDSTAIMGPVDGIAGRPHRKKGGGEPPQKPCPECGKVSPAGARKCPKCGYAFPFDAAWERHSSRASTAAVLMSDIKPERLDVTQVMYSKHQKPGKMPTLKVTYVCGLKTFPEWVCFQHVGFPRDSARRWWMARTGNAITPSTVDEVLNIINSQGITCPDSITVKPNGKYSDITRHHFDQTAAGSPEQSSRNNHQDTGQSLLSSVRAL